MPFIIILIIAAMIGSYGFWDTVQAILGALGALFLLIGLGAALIAAMAVWIANRAGRTFRSH